MIRINLSAILGKKRMSQAELSQATGIRPNTINDIYHELAISVKLEHLDLICEALDCELSELIEYIPKKKK
jgi:putative transcriptional regulator